MKYHPDAHWSCAFYIGLNYIQYTDGSQIYNINRDDAASFHLDSLTTHKQHKGLMVKGKEINTTGTDYVNSYPSALIINNLL